MFTPRPHEVFVEGGAYNGRTTVDFVRWAKQGYDLSYVFEANKKNEAMCKETLAQAGIEKYQLIMKGTWDKEESVRFNSQASTGSCVAANGDAVMEMTSLDQTIGDGRVTFIKLDVEGSEYRTLLGAKHIITTQKPRLAISIYHKIEDFVILPQLVMDILPEYHLAMRSHTSSNEETVLYAWVDE